MVYLGAYVVYICYNQQEPWQIDMLLWHYRQVSNVRRTLVGNKIVDHSDVVGAAPTHSDVVGASPVGAAPTTSSFST